MWNVTVTAARVLIKMALHPGGAIYQNSLLFLELAWVSSQIQ